MANPFFRIDLAFAAFVAALFLIGAAADPADPAAPAAAPPAVPATPAVQAGAMAGCCARPLSCPAAGAQHAPAAIAGCPHCPAPHALPDH